MPPSPLLFLFQLLVAGSTILLGDGIRLGPMDREAKWMGYEIDVKIRAL